MLTVKEIRRLQRKGLGDAKIAKELGYTKMQVYRFRLANNIPNSEECRNKLKQKKLEKVLKNKDAVGTQTELAKKLGMTDYEVSRIIKSNNIEFTRKPTDTLRKRRFGCWKVTSKPKEGVYRCTCDCGNIKDFTRQQLLYNINRCDVCGFSMPSRDRERKFLADYKRAEKYCQKNLKKRGKNYIINNIISVKDLGTDKYVNLLCSKGHMTKNKFDNYEGCVVCKHNK